jgi:hypothetical protein
MSLILQELGIVMAMQQPNPNLVTAKFLQLSGIIPPDWQLAREPIHHDNVSQLLFTNGVSIVAEPNRIMFGEPIGDRAIPSVGFANDSLTVARVAHNYTEIFKLAKYSAVGINIRSYSPQASIDAATDYINHQLLASGAWQNYGIAPVQANLSLAYTLPGRQLNLEINPARIQVDRAEITPVILFSGNFIYNLVTAELGETLASVGQVLNNWQADLSTYCELITDRFLNIKAISQLPISPVSHEYLLATEGEIPYAPNLFPAALT